MSDPPFLVVVGPTAGGKSALAVELARRLGAEVVNADAMALYRGMDIGTATPSVAERRGVPHHLFDLWDIREAANVAGYQAAARALVDDLLDAGTPVVLVGGSGLYVRAVLDPLRFPGTDPQLRTQLEAELARDGPLPLHARLATADPQAAAAVLPTNGRRLVRALEVVALQGSFAAALPPYGPAHRGACQLGLDPGVAAVDARVADRVAAMAAHGPAAEVDALCGRGLREGPTARKALGYAQLLAWRDGAIPDLDTAWEQTVRATRRFVRRQRSWFRRDPRICWYDDPADALAAQGD